MLVDRVENNLKWFVVRRNPAITGGSERFGQLKLTRDHGKLFAVSVHEIFLFSFDFESISFDIL